MSFDIEVMTEDEWRRKGNLGSKLTFASTGWWLEEESVTRPEVVDMLGEARTARLEQAFHDGKELPGMHSVSFYFSGGRSS